MTSHPNRARRESALPFPSPADIAAHRASLGLTQSQYAGLLAYSEDTVRSWELGRKRMHPATWLMYRAIGVPKIRRLLRGLGLWDGEVQRK